MFCGNCGKEIGSPSHKFCENCGSAISTQNPPMPPAETKKVTPCPQCGSKEYSTFHNWCPECGILETSKLNVANSLGDTHDNKGESVACPSCKALTYDPIYEGCFSCGYIKQQDNDPAVKTPEVNESYINEGQYKTAKQHSSFIGRYKLQGIMIVGFLIALIIYLLDRPRDFEKSQELINGQKLSQAIDSLKSIEISKTNALSDSAQRIFDRDSSDFYIARLHEISIKPNPSIDSFLRIADVFRLYPNYLEQVRSSSPNGAHIAQILETAIGLKRALDSAILSVESNLTKIDEKMSSISETFELFKQSGCRIMSFGIKRKFDLHSSGKGIYDALAYSPFQKCVLIAGDNDIPTLEYQRMRVTLTVRDLGEKQYKVGDGYGYSTVEYIRTYETDESYGNIERDKSIYNELRRLRPSSLAKYERTKKIESANFIVNINKLLDSLRLAFQVR